jgi:hypothetical protein
MPPPEHAEAERKAEAQTFLDALAPGGRFMFQTFDDNANRKDGSLARKLYGTLDDHWRELNDLNERGAGVYITVNETDGKGRETTNIVAIRAAFVDFDGQPQPENPHVPPTVITETSPGRWHYFWCLRDCPLEQFTPLQKRLIELYGSDPKIIDRPRVMRVPGFLHRKREPFLSKLVFAGDAEYSYDEFVEALPPEPEPETRERPQPPRPGERIGTRDLNSYALERLDWWVPSLFPGAKKSNQGWRVTSKSLGRILEEDIGIARDGIVDFGVADMGDAKQGKRTPIDLVMEWHYCDFKGAVHWLSDRLGLPAPVWQGNGRDDSAPGTTSARSNKQGKATTPTNIVILSKREFLAGFVPPDYLVDAVLQRRFVYSVTAVTSHGKTALALLLAQTVGSADPNTRFGPHGVEKGSVLYFVGENPDDVRCRIIGDDSTRSDDPNRDRICYIEGVFDIAQMRARVVAEVERVGGFDLVIVDTSAAYFLQSDENSNTQIGAHARMLRSLTELPGGPCVVPLCHPIKHVTEPSQLLPRGGGAFLNEMDGNLTLWLHDENLITLNYNKLRGPGFEPITFKLDKITTPALVDSKGRQIPTVHAVAITEAEEKKQEESAEYEENRLLAALAGKKPLSVAELAQRCGWLHADGTPYKSKVQRVIARLKVDQLVMRVRGRKYRLTEKGRKELGADDDDEITKTVEDRSGAVSNKPFHALRGMKQRDTVPCVYCGKTGDVYKFADGRLPKGQRHHADLHEGCAEDFFTGKPKSTNEGHEPPDSLLH